MQTIIKSIMNLEINCLLNFRLNAEISSFAKNSPSNNGFSLGVSDIITAHKRILFDHRKTLLSVKKKQRHW